MPTRVMLKIRPQSCCGDAEPRAHVGRRQAHHRDVEALEEGRGREQSEQQAVIRGDPRGLDGRGATARHKPAHAIPSPVARTEAGDWQALRFERRGDVLRIVLAHPSRPQNRVDGLLHGELARLFRALKREDEARALLLTAEGPAFSAGGDFAWFPTLDDLAKLEHLRRDAKQMIWDLLDVELPIVAALNGPAIGLGASLALLCDVIFMAEGASLADPHVRVGIAAGDGGTAIWPLRPRASAREAVPAHGRRRSRLPRPSASAS